jgi:hypothetical protein
MGYYTIKLPDNKKGSVRFGPIKKIKTISHFFRRKKLDEERLAYIITIETSPGNERTFYIMKTKEGQWLNEAENDEMCTLKKMIDQYETQNLVAGKNSRKFQTA